MPQKPTERTPLVGTTSQPSNSGFISPVRRVYLISCLTALSFAITQTTLIYSFRVMTCDQYYATHDPGIVTIKDRCSLPAIEAQTARSIAWMSSNTVLCSIINLFVTGYWSKRFGIKAAMFQQTIWASFRTLTQIYGVSIGKSFGVNLIMTTQIINILGSGGGYQLAANSYVAALVDSEHRTGSFGVMAGFTMFGQALGFILGGLGYNQFGLLFPFQAAFVLLNISTISGMIFLPYVDPSVLADGGTKPTTMRDAAQDNEGTKNARSFLAPLKLFVPRRRVQEPAGSKSWDLNLTLMSVGVFFSVLATGYVGMALQLVGTNIFGFEPGMTGLLQSLTLTVKAVFLSLCFPKIISFGRRNLSSARSSNTAKSVPPRPRRPSSSHDEISEQTLCDDPISPSLAEASHLLHPPQPEPTPPADTSKPSMEFDLHFLRYSILLDGFLTACVAYSYQGWHLFVAAAILPLASGTSSAAKGVTLDFVKPEERGDALNAIALVEKLAQVSTIGLFGFIFAMLSEIGKPTLVFVVNGAIALVGFLLLLFVRMPSPASSDSEII